MFNVPPENMLLKQQLKPGDIVTFTFDSYSRRAAPVDPKITHKREDISWEDILDDYTNEVSQANQLTGRIPFPS